MFTLFAPYLCSFFCKEKIHIYLSTLHFCMFKNFTPELNVSLTNLNDFPQKLQTLYLGAKTKHTKKILQAHGVNTRKYWLVEVIENGCIVTRVRVYNEILPEPSANPWGSALGISLRLRQYFIVYLSSRHNTVTVKLKVWKVRVCLLVPLLRCV